MPSDGETIEEARRVLRDLGFDDLRCNKRSALTLLALAGVGPGCLWSDAFRSARGITELMLWIAERWEIEYKPNTRETFRDETMHYFVAEGLVVKNPDDPCRPTNSPKTNYALADDALAVLRAVGTVAYDREVMRYREKRGRLAGFGEASRRASEHPVLLPGCDNQFVYLSPGGQSVIVASMIEEFCIRFVPSGIVLFVDDASSSLELDAALLAELGINLGAVEKKPDLIVYDVNADSVYLMEACYSGGPVDSLRKEELKSLFAATGRKLVFVTCFLSRRELAKYVSSLAWGTLAWCVDEPDCIISLEIGSFGL